MDVNEIIHVDGTAQVPNAKGKMKETPVHRVERLPRQHHALGLEGRLLPELPVPGQGRRQPDRLCRRPTTRRTACCRRRRTTTPPTAVRRSRSTTRSTFRGRDPARRPDQQVAVPRREEDVHLLGRRHSEGRGRDVRRHRQPGRARGLRLRRAGPEDADARSPRGQGLLHRRQAGLRRPAHRVGHRPGRAPGPHRPRRQPGHRPAPSRSPTTRCRSSSTRRRPTARAQADPQHGADRRSSWSACRSSCSACS